MMPVTPGLILDLLGRAVSLKDESDWTPYRAGVHIRWLYQCAEGPAAALLRYQANASVPFHEHVGYEHILVLDGEQSDERGRYPTGTLIINAPGSRHQVRSEAGCVVLIIWERAVRILSEPAGVPPTA